MRIHEGEFAYDLERPRDPLTQLALNWRFTVYRLRPAEMVVFRGEATTQPEAEKKARNHKEKAAIRQSCQSAASLVYLFRAISCRQTGNHRFYAAGGGHAQFVGQV